MADWYGSARSNYFRVKDIGKFRDWVKSIPGLVLMESALADKIGLVGIYSEDFFGGWPDTSREIDVYYEFDLLTELGKHLVDGEVAILREIGAEKLRYLTGWSGAITNKGKPVYVNLNDIYEKAAKKFKIPNSSIIECTY